MNDLRGRVERIAPERVDAPAHTADADHRFTLAMAAGLADCPATLEQALVGIMDTRAPKPRRMTRHRAVPARVAA